MTVVRLDRRLGALEAKRDLASMQFRNLSDAQLEVRIDGLRGQLLDALGECGIDLPTDWYQWSQAQQDQWVAARIEELPQ